MADIKKLDPTGERVAATEAVETTPISGKEHEYRADGDHHPRQDSAAVEGGRTHTTGQAGSERNAPPEAGVQTERHISKGIPGAGETPDTHAEPDAKRDHSPRV